MSSQNLNVAIVGGGLTGLIAAAQLVASGKPASPVAKVTIYEAGPAPGGRATTSVHEGFSLNQGAHALYRGGDTMAFFKMLGVAVPGNPPNTFDGVAMRSGELHVLPLSPGDMIKTKLFATGEKLEMAGFLMGLAKIDQKTLSHTSARTWVESVSKNPQVRQFLAALLRLCTYCNDLDALSAQAAVSQFVLSQAGVLYVDGGWQTLVDALLAYLSESAGRGSAQVEIRTGVKVKALNKAGEKISIAIGTAESESFDAVILAVPPKALLDLLQELPDVLPENHLSTLRGSPVACLDICLSQAPAEKVQYGLGIDEPLYYSMHSKPARLTASPEQSLIQMSYYLGPQDEDYLQDNGQDKFQKAMLDFLAKLQPGYQDKLIYKRYLPRMQASYGLPLASAGGSQGLATPQTKIDNLFVCGDYVGFNKFLADASTSSAVLAASQLLQWADRAYALASEAK